jgi:hypothetical protein
MGFTVADFNVRGELGSVAEYECAQLEQIPGAGEIIGHLSGALWKEPNEFQTNLPFGNHLTLRWLASATTSGIATIRYREELVSLSLLASGLNAEADRLTFEAMQIHLIRQLHDTGYEPAFALMELKQRPLIATINVQSPVDPTDRLTASLADRCFAASYFRYLRLA